MSKTRNLSNSAPQFNALVVPVGTTAQRPSVIPGYIRFNTDLNTLESANSTAWANVGSGSASSGGGGVTWLPVQNTNFIAVTGSAYFVNTYTSNVTVTLPANPTIGQEIRFVDYGGYMSANGLIIYPNGNKILGNTANATLTTNTASISIVYSDTNKGWIPYSGFTSSPIGNYSIQALIVAGGGGGTSAICGGAGAGGLIFASSIPVVPGTPYSLVVGAGGSVATNGVNSSGFGQTAIGGAQGGPGYGGAGYSGGSGSGGSRSSGANGPVYPGGSGTSGQGNPGGAGSNTGGSDNYGSGGGGGGAGASGGAASGATGGNGGSGSAYAISGSSVYYAGGGGGSSYNGNGGTGGVGGGSPGTGSLITPNNGSTNTGGGAGAAGYNAGGAPAASGGSGIIIVSYLGGQRGMGGAVTQSGGYTIHTFTGSGTFTA